MDLGTGNQPSPSPVLLSRRAVVGTAAKLGYTAPIIVGSFHLATLSARAADPLISGGIEELPTCTPTATPPVDSSPTPTPGGEESTPTPTPGGGASTPTPTPGSGSSPTPTPGKTPPVSDKDDDDDLVEILTVKLLPQTGDGASLIQGCH